VGLDAHNHWFETRIKESLEDAGVPDQCRWKAHRHLHTKGILTDRALVSGSMNFTRNGIRVLDEVIELCFAPRFIADARVHFESYEHD
jgi:hypothetical protein